MSLISHLQIVLSAVFFLLFLHQQPFLTALPVVLPQPDPSPVQSFLPTLTPPTTIPAFPEQSNLAGCPLDLPEELFQSINHACDGNNKAGHLSRTKCCPVLAAWLYSAYSGTALTRASRMTAASYDLPVLPDDSETCVDNLDKALKGKGIELRKPNETCDLVFCYCGIRLPPLSCTEAFSVSPTEKGKLIGDQSVRRLEGDCLNQNNNGGISSLSGCSKCLNRLYQLNEDKSVNNKSSKSDRKSKMHGRDCSLMGLTWLLDKNRTAYMPTVTSVLRALMMSKDGSDPRSCSLARDGLPLAVDSAELNDQSSSNTVRFRIVSVSVILKWKFVEDFVLEGAPLTCAMGEVGATGTWVCLVQLRRLELLLLLLSFAGTLLY
ncbi:hypothetical protein BVC80_9071g101 [Macleaya cordata]|uniref:SPARK domain-containing protein n=1 Tax=Macleaya cordata TaxID=56857 RepID=A0A200PU82_MACCD|nr:hypothetical protein BVC80_9071g101 [Macleaya cordata]